MMNGIFLAGAAGRLARSNEAINASTSASRAAAQVRTQNEALQRDVEKLFMITEAFWEILKDRHGYTDEHLGEMIRAIDMRSGQLNGKGRKQQNPACPKCQRTLIGKQSVCLYCGTEVFRDPFER